jgi:aspartate dehydrogenase
MTRRIGLIGHGGIGRAVAQAVDAGRAGDWTIAAILVRRPIAGDARVLTDRRTFLDVPVDLYVETAGPDALRDIGTDALARADLWSVNGTALADDGFRTRLERTGRENGHRMRLVSGAIGGLDAVQAMTIDPDASVEVRVTAPEDGPVFTGSAREAAARLPHGVNLTVATALAGLGVDRTMVRVMPDAEESRRAIGLEVRSAYGTFTGTLAPHTDVSRGLHVVAASIIGALRQLDSVIWAG